MKRFFYAILLVVFAGVFGNANCATNCPIISEIDKIAMEYRTFLSIKTQLSTRVFNCEDGSCGGLMTLLETQRAQIDKKIDALQNVIAQMPFAAVSKIYAEVCKKLETEKAFLPFNLTRETLFGKFHQ